MKVFHQTWRPEYGGPELNSISRDRVAYEETMAYAANPGENNKDGPTLPTGELLEITIPDDSEFARLVKQRGTIFLHDDEMDMVWNAPELKE
jgi:hypothetical protein